MDIAEIRNIYRNHLIKGPIINFLDSVQDKIDSNAEHIKNWFANIYELKFLHNYIHDESITEIIVHSPNFIQLEKNGILINIQDEFTTYEDLNLACETLTTINGIEWNYKKPFASFYGEISNFSFRVTILHENLSPSKHPKIVLRRIKNRYFDFNEFGLDKESEEFIKGIVQNKQNILISGSTGSGKTSLLKTMLNHISNREHVVILEDTFEINTKNSNFTNLVSDELQSGKTLEEYCAYALRIRPDRIVLGEIRSKEIRPFLMSMNSGHKGAMATIHGNSGSEALTRAALLFAIYQETNSFSFNEILRLICQNIDYVIQVKHRKVIEIIQILGSENGVPYYESIH